MSVLFRAALALADVTPPADVDPTTGKGPEWGKAAPIGLLIILLLGIALVFLVRSMSRNLKKVPDSFEQQGTDLPSRGDLIVDAAGPASSPSVGRPGPDADPGAPGLVNDRSG